MTDATRSDDSAESALQQTGGRQAQAYHTLAITSQALPVVRDLREDLEELGHAAEAGDGGLDEAAGQLEAALKELRALQSRANHLANSPRSP